MIEQIKQIGNKCFERELNLHHFHLHHYGNHQELTFHIKLDGDMSLDKAHEIASKLEVQIKEKLDIISTIHMEPFCKK